MIEAATTTRQAQAFRAAHDARGAVLVQMVKWLFTRRDVPLSQPVLTEPSRCA